MHARRASDAVYRQELWNKAFALIIIVTVVLLQGVLVLSNMCKAVVGFAACGGAGKTTLLNAMTPQFRRRAFRVDMIKQTHHAFGIDTPGKDSFNWAMMQAGELGEE